MGNQSKPRVSVIMTAYNNKDTISEAIDSLLAQTYLDWELIVCDDASTDNTYNIVKAYLDKYPNKIVLLSNVWNCGAAYGRNHCIQHSRGEYLAILDGDDIAMPDRLEKQVAFLDEHPEYAIVGSNAIIFDRKKAWKTREMPKGPIKRDFLNNRVFINSSTILRRSVVIEVKGFTVNEHTRRGQDTELWSKLYGKGYNGYNIQENLIKYREDEAEYKRRGVRKNWQHYLHLNLRVIKNLGLPKWYYSYVVITIIRGLMPEFIYNLYHRARSK